jgi:MinD-like ATPase involved in chromosome partitioning or flagellar assembly
MSSQVAGLKRFASKRSAERWADSGDRSIVVGGVKGGTGASTVAALLALACAADGRRTLLVDTDDIVGSQHRMLGVSGQNGFASLQDPSITADKTLLPVADACWLIPGGLGGDTNHVPVGTSERRLVFRRIAQLYSDFDVVVIDAGSRLDGIIAAAGRGAWRFVAVSGTEPVALASSYALVKAIETRWPGAPVEVLINRHDESRARAAYEQIRTATQHFLSRSIGFSGAIPDDTDIAAAITKHEPLTQLSVSAAARRAVMPIAIRLLAELDEAPAAASA